MIANTVTKRPRLPRGVAKAIVATMEPGKPVVVRKDYIGAVRSAAQYMGVRISINQRFRVGFSEYEAVLLPKKGA